MSGKGKELEDHLCQVLLTKPAEVLQEAVQMLEKHGCHVKAELKSELYYNRSRCHGNARLNDDSKSQRSFARDYKFHTRTWRAECA